jgi:hypothetical protein
VTTAHLLHYLPGGGISIKAGYFGEPGPGDRRHLHGRPDRERSVLDS